MLRCQNTLSQKIAKITEDEQHLDAEFVSEAVEVAEHDLCTMNIASTEQVIDESNFSIDITQDTTVVQLTTNVRGRISQFTVNQDRA